MNKLVILCSVLLLAANVAFAGDRTTNAYHGGPSSPRPSYGQVRQANLVLHAEAKNPGSMPAALVAQSQAVKAAQAAAIANGIAHQNGQ